jgi:hypothetical protein
LKKIGLVETDKEHPVFGDWAKLVSDTFCRQMYLVREKLQTTDSRGQAAYEYRVGPRSRYEIPEARILRFIAEVRQQKKKKTCHEM